MPCHPENMSLTALRALPVSKTCPGLLSNNARGTTVGVAVHTVVGVAIVTPWGTASSTTLVAQIGTGPETFTSVTPSTVARPVAFTSARTCLTSRPPEAITPTGSSPWPCVWWSKTACRIAPRRGTSGGTTASLCPSPPSRTGWRPRGKKAEPQVEAAYLDWALSEFSGYLAADELYDGPFCVLSVVDARRQRRLLYEVLDHDPTRLDILLFLARLQKQLTARGLTARGITTDASPLYPLPIPLALGDIPHQICEFHILKELTHAVLRVLAQIRKRLTELKPKRPRGRPKTTAEG